MPVRAMFKIAENLYYKMEQFPQLVISWDLPSTGTR